MASKLRIVLFILLLVFLIGAGFQYARPIYKRYLAKSYIARGVECEVQGAYDDAIADYTTAIRLDPGSIDAHARRAGAWLQKNQADKAIADYTEALRLGPPNPAYEEGFHYWRRAYAHEKQGDLELAIADYTEAVRILPCAAAYNDRGDCWRKMRNFDQAIADYTESILREPHESTAFLKRASVYLDRASHDKAMADLLKAVELEPEHVWVNNQLAWLYATTPDGLCRDGKKAVEFATQACDRTSWQFARFITTLAAAHAEAGNFDEAVSMMQKAMELDTKDQFKELHEKMQESFKAKKPWRVEPKK